LIFGKKQVLIMRVILRDYQVKAVENIRDAYRRGLRAPLLVLSTGAGKTVIFCDITERVVLKKNRVYILVHRQELLRQTSEHLDRLGIDHGLIAPGNSLTGDPVQVASVQTLVKRLHKLPEPDLIILDECHHSAAGSWRKILDAWPRARLLGVTATPCRLDGSGLGKHVGGYFDCLVEGPTIRNLIDRGFLSQPVVYAPPSEVDLSGVQIKAGDFDQKQIAERVDKPKITGCAIEHYQRLCPGAPAIAFTTTIEHAEHVAAQFNAAGIPAAHLAGDLPDTVRRHRIEQLANGQLRVLTSCNIISEGTDIPVVTAAILLRPTQSMGLYLQQVGRALRVCPGKSKAIILDHVGNCLRHGLPDEKRSWTLDASKKKKREKNEIQEARNRQCDVCYAVFSAGLSKCPQCGAEVKTSREKLMVVDGELKEMTAESIENWRKVRKIEEWRADSLEEFIEIGRQRGYAPAWAHIRWENRKRRMRARQYPPTLGEYKENRMALA
jgi:superfamily II DNA or RNA helicase